MKLEDYINTLSSVEKVMLLARLEGMEMAMRICRKRAEALQPSIDAAKNVGADSLPAVVRQNEANTCAELIRIIQVHIGSGRTPFGDLTEEEKDELYRIS